MTGITEKELTEGGGNVTTQMRVALKNYNSFIYSDAYGNCKHCYIDSIGGLLTAKNTPNLARVIDLVTARRVKTTFSVNLNDVEQVERLKKHFKLISCATIPTGYGTSYQFHAIFFVNHNSRNRDNYLKRFQYNGSGPIVSTNVKLKGAALAERGATKEITDEIVDKVFSYKTKHWLKKYLIKLIG